MSSLRVSNVTDVVRDVEIVLEDGAISLLSSRPSFQ